MIFGTDRILFTVFLLKQEIKESLLGFLDNWARLFAVIPQRGGVVILMNGSVAII